MITKSLILHLLQESLLSGRDHLGSAQKTLESITQKYSITSADERGFILHGILSIAEELFHETYGFKEFDLILSRAFPTVGTLRFIQEQEGDNVWTDSTK